MTRTDDSRQLATASLVAMIFSNLSGAAVGLARLHAMADALIGVNSALAALGLFALPLTWWGRKTGLLCGIAVGVINTLGNVSAFAQGVPTSGAMPPVLVLIPICQTVFSVFYVIVAVKLWAELRRKVQGS